MRECPKCYYVDPPNWRTPPHYPNLDYVRFDEFQELEPELAAILLPGKEVEDELYVYHRSTPKKAGRPGYVYRIWKPIWKAYGHEGWRAVRKSRMYDAEGRLNKNTWHNLQRIVNARSNFRRHNRGSLEKYLVVTA